MTTRTLSVVCSALLLATGACSAVDLAVEADAVCTTVPAIEFAGNPYSATSVSMSQDVDIAEQLDDLAEAIADLSDDLGLDASAHLDAATLTVQSVHLDSLDFVSTFEVIALGDTETHALAALDPDLTVGLTAELLVEPVDLIGLIADNTRELNVTLTGQAPSEPWQLGLDLCFSAAASYQ